MQDQSEKVLPTKIKKTVVIGASPNPSRYSFLAVEKLRRHGFEAVPLGIAKGNVDTLEIQDLKQMPKIPDVDTVTLYLNPANQQQWQDYILSLKPKRIIFNPGTENPAFEAEARAHGIEPIQACTLVMLSIGNF